MFQKYGWNPVPIGISRVQQFLRNCLVNVALGTSILLTPKIILAAYVPLDYYDSLACAFPMAGFL